MLPKKRSFRDHHLLSLLEGYDHQHLPLDLFINIYFKTHKALGSKDRAHIAETTYKLVRWQGLLDYIGGEATWKKRLEALKNFHPDAFLKKEEIPISIRLSFPKPLFQLLVESHGYDKACELCLASNRPAPTTVRVNTLKISREELLSQWQDRYEVSSCLQSPTGIIFHKRINFFELPEFKAGFFEVQDEGSQLIANLVEAQPGQWVLDYCSGSGGKTLAFAPALQKTGQIFLHDVRPSALQEARKRLRRAGIQNAQAVQPEDPKLKKLKRKMHWVLTDVPCTGTGTLRRNPDMKWKFTQEMLQRLVGEQRLIFEKALSFLHPDGRIVYATCSLLKEENQQQLEHFLKTYPLEVEGKIFQSLPSDGSMDGFFGAVLKFS